MNIATTQINISAREQLVEKGLSSSKVGIYTIGKGGGLGGGVRMNNINRTGPVDRAMPSSSVGIPNEKVLPLKY